MEKRATEGVEDADARAEGAWIGERHTEQREAWMRQIFEAQTWRQVRGPAEAVTSDPCSWHQVAAVAHPDV